MDQHLSRWAQIVYLTPEELDSLHHREVLLGTRSGPSNYPLYVQMGAGTWMDMNRIKTAMTRIFPSGYYPKEMLPGEQEASMDTFSKAIYPLWKRIKELDNKAEAKLSNEEVSALKVLMEVTTTHKQDRAIYDSGHKPTRIVIPADFRKKAAASDKYSGWDKD